MRVVETEGLLPALRDALAGGPCVCPAPAVGVHPEAPVEADDIALIVTTSGSTGDPKGVLLSRAALTAGAQATHARLGGPGVWHCALPTHYVAGVMTLVRAVIAGTNPVFVRADLSDVRVQAGRNYLSVVPTQLHRALADDRQVAALAAFDAVLVGGAALAPDLHARALAAGVPVVTTYGMSETCGGCVYDGIPLAGVSIEVAGDARVTIGGPTLFSGYRLDPERTSSSLVNGRFITSDRGVWDGTRLEITGRVDDVVITGGVNVDLARVQRACEAEFGADVAVVGLPDDVWGTMIVAVTTLDVSVAEVRARLEPLLQRVAMPRQVRRVGVIPVTERGKIDQRRIIADWNRGR